MASASALLNRYRLRLHVLRAFRRLLRTHTFKHALYFSISRNIQGDDMGFFPMPQGWYSLP